MKQGDTRPQAANEPMVRAGAASASADAAQAPASSATAREALNRRAARRSRRRRRLAFGAVFALAAAAGAVWWGLYAGTELPVTYRFVSVDRGSIDRVVSSTGVLDAVNTVRVGTQVSGIISEINADFNDEVTAGQVVARIDPKLLEAAVLDAETSLARNLAQLSQAQSQHQKSERLWRDGLTSEVEYDTTRYALEVTEQTVASAEIAVDRARQNLAYATIYAPISGTVIERNVDLGQTVAASLSAPQLFMIAADLSRMQILVSVDESDIGLVEPGQLARFTVQAYRNDAFVGTVRQVRLQSDTSESVVTYTVVVDVDNDDRRLLPGMTATVDFVVESAADVFRVPNAALRFVPPEAALPAPAISDRGGAQLDGTREAPAAGRERGGGFADRGQAGSGGGARDAGAARERGAARAGGQGGVGRVWLLDEAGQLVPTRVVTGITDGQWTEVRGAGLELGMQLVAGVTQVTESVVNPFQSSSNNTPQRGGFR